MPRTAVADQPTATALIQRDRDLLRAVGRGLTDTEIATVLGTSVRAVADHLDRVLVRLGLRDRAAAIVYAFDSGLVIPGHGPRWPATVPVPRITISQPSSPATGRRLRISVLGPLQAWLDGQPLDLGPIRQQAVLAALALRPGRTVRQPELLDGVWGLDQPAGNVVAVYVYRLRKLLHAKDSQPDSVIRRDRDGYCFASSAVQMDVALLEDLVTATETAARANELAEAVHACSRALDLFRGEPLSGLPGPFAELERLRLTERRTALVQRKLGWQLRLGQHAEAIAELSALVAAQPQNEQVAALLMRALNRSGRRAEALAVFTRIRRQLADELGVAPGETLRLIQQAVLHGDDTRLGFIHSGAAC